ncbi:MAG: OmpA family protein [Sulfitobacter sp.]
MAFYALYTQVSNGPVHAQNNAMETSPTSKQIKALAGLPAPAAPSAFAVAEQDTGEPYLSSRAESDCVGTLDKMLRPALVQFEAGSAKLSPANTHLLEQISDRVMACKGAYLMVAGHAYSGHDDAANLALSWERADRTLERLIILGVDAHAAEAVGYGARVPLSQGSADESALDRRVEFRVMQRRDLR